MAGKHLNLAGLLLAAGISTVAAAGLAGCSSSTKTNTPAAPTGATSPAPTTATTAPSGGGVSY